jgi:bifunctional DNA-binding transcriptional regulator/antitoxin component of YhaV-PrlF toxin-antitoxin module
VGIKQKLQVVIPEAVRRKVPPAVGDLVEVEAKGGRIVLKPKAVVDRDIVERSITEGLRDLDDGRVSPKFDSEADMRAWLNRRR